MIIDSYHYTSIGGRDINQDAVGIEEDASGGIYIVADGLGGHQHGELSAKCAVSVLKTAWRSETEKGEGFLANAIAAANSQILKIQEENFCVTKSTIAALAISKDTAFLAHSGDSRIYCIRENEIASITEDHSVAYKKFKSGEITRQQIAQDEDQSSLLRVLGKESRWEPECSAVNGLKAGDAFLLCSDGLWELLLDEEILIDYLKAETASEWANLLLLRAIDRIEPGHDNLSVVTVILK